MKIACAHLCAKLVLSCVYMLGMQVHPLFKHFMALPPDQLLEQCY